MREDAMVYLSEGERAGQRYVLGLPRQTPRGVAGTAMGQRAGSSLEFKDHREYQVGDDLRHIDWNAFARTDQLSVKLYREEVVPHVDVIIDGSRSMALEDSAKARATLGLVGLLATAARNAGFAHTAWMMGAALQPVANSGGPPSGWGAIEWTSSGSPLDLLGRGAPVWRPRGVRVLLSDLLWVGEPRLALRPITEGAALAVVVQVLAECDVNPPEGDLRLVDAETEQVREIHVDAAVLQGYREALVRHQQNWHEACRQCGALFSTLVAESVVRDWRLDELVAMDFLRVV
jgi:uncharacterized protein (DUF58 family)